MLPSPDAPFSLAALWHALFWPLLRLLLGLAVGLLIANLLEALRWTRYLARLAAPLARTAHLREVAGASFSLAFVSPAAANGLLSDSHGAGEISGRELMLANLFNSLPAYLVHTPTIFLLTWPVLGAPAVTYVGLTLLAAAGRTGFTVLLARRLLPPPPPGCLVCKADGDARTDWGAALRKAWKRFLRRLPKLVYFTVPVYVLMYLLQLYGFFNLAEEWLAAHMGWLSFLKPQAMGIIVLHLPAARRGAGPDGGQHPVHAHAGRPAPAAVLHGLFPPGPGPAPDSCQSGAARRQYGSGDPAVLFFVRRRGHGQEQNRGGVAG